MDGGAYGLNHLSVHCGGTHQVSSTGGMTCRNGVAGTCYSYCSNKTWCQLSRTEGIAPAVAGAPFLYSGPQLVYDESRLILMALWKTERG
jgi:hypothetical protein